MAVRINTARRNTAADALVGSLTVLDIYTGAQPASAGTTAPGTLLASITGLTWGSAASGTASVVGTPNATSVATGTAGWGRFRNTADTHRIDGTVGEQFTLANPNLVEGGAVTLTSASLTQPSGE